MRSRYHHLDMVGVVGSSPIAPTKFGRENKHLAETPSAFFLAVPKRYQNQSLLGASLDRGRGTRERAAGVTLCRRAWRTPNKAPGRAALLRSLSPTTAAGSGRGRRLDAGLRRRPVLAPGVVRHVRSAPVPSTTPRVPSLPRTRALAIFVVDRFRPSPNCLMVVARRCFARTGLPWGSPRMRLVHCVKEMS
jgi:hypothetical protein